MSWNNTVKLVTAIGVSELAGVIGAVFTAPSIPAWYAGLVKPALNPPAWIFGPVWTTLYALMGVSLFLVWKRNSESLQNVRMSYQCKWAVGLFFVQLALNSLWSIFFSECTAPRLRCLIVFFCGVPFSRR